ncbi:hypothetical protein FHP05_14400 [Cerasibacillus terrae]|uniref:CcoQ/FixQ family Cbb3-type cytochrome c oxidase assembly chaperone n=1 Tax=Cerasibacillus terrae TaxID=2498845 RepID=A0A5C8NGR5_9BACI|nr:hypothetical protein [Cerasibacillus terrae]TXL58151.1 hypothetical protein FHP05_14400 [Cerasibacillus terrae]
MMEFLYFPNDKAEYIPAIIIFAVFFIAAVVTTVFFIKKSKKEEKTLQEKYEHVTFDDQNHTNQK